MGRPLFLYYDDGVSERGTRYEAAVATFVAVLALAISAYTAYVQKQQVRAQVLPILQFGTSNAPHFVVGVDNKGVGPALIKHVVVTVDGEALPTWHDVLQKVLGPGKHNYSESDIGSLIMAPNETVNILTPFDDNGEPLKPAKDGDGAKFNEGRLRIAIEICYCSTLGDCWLLKSGPRVPDSREDVRRCPARSERTFRQ